MRSKSTILNVFTLAVVIVATVLWIGWGGSAAADTSGSGTIAGRVFEPGAANYKQTQLTVLPTNGADAYGVFVTAECFDVVFNGDPWPNAIPACR